MKVIWILDVLVKNLDIPRGWEINTIKIQGLSTSVTYLELQWCRACNDISSKVKDKSLPLVPPTNKSLYGLALWIYMDFRGNAFLTWVYNSSYCTKWLRKLLVLSDARKLHRRLCNWFRLLCTLLSHLALYEVANTIVLEVSVEDRKCCVEFLVRPNWISRSMKLLLPGIYSSVLT